MSSSTFEVPVQKQRVRLLLRSYLVSTGREAGWVMGMIMMISPTADDTLVFMNL